MQKFFLETKEKLVEKVYELENLKRREYYAQYKYFILFHDYIVDQTKLQYENKNMLDSIKAKRENVEFNLQEKEIELENKLIAFENNCKIAKQVLGIYDKYTKEDIEKLDENYKEFVSKYHPAINVKSSQEQVQLYQALTSIYLIGEVKEFESMYETAKDRLSELVIEEDMEKILETYNLSLNNITPLIEKRKESLPFKYEEIVDNEYNITNEISKFRQNIYTLKEMNKNIKLDYELNFNEQI